METLGLRGAEMGGVKGNDSAGDGILTASAAWENDLGVEGDFRSRYGLCVR